MQYTNIFLEGMEQSDGWTTFGRIASLFVLSVKSNGIVWRHSIALNLRPEWLEENSHWRNFPDRNSELNSTHCYDCVSTFLLFLSFSLRRRRHLSLCSEQNHCSKFMIAHVQAPSLCCLLRSNSIWILNWNYEQEKFLSEQETSTRCLLVCKESFVPLWTELSSARIRNNYFWLEHKIISGCVWARAPEMRDGGRRSQIGLIIGNMISHSIDFAKSSLKSMMGTGEREFCEFEI